MSKRLAPRISISTVWALLFTLPSLAGPPDTDSDGIPDDSDNCPLVANPTQEDCNSDGVGDACESDCDSNGIADVCEIESQIAKLIAFDATEGDRFGVSVALSGDTALVGAPADSPPEPQLSTGSAYVFTRFGAVWAQQQKLAAADIPEPRGFGGSVSVSSDTAVIGAPGDGQGGTNAGAAYVFTRMGASWSQQAKLRASDAAAYDLFGNSVAVSGHTAVVGAFADDHAGWTDAGSAYVFIRSGGVWTQQQKLTASDPFTYDYFGSAVAVSGDTAVIGASNDGNSGFLATGYGAAYVFTRTGSVWSQQAKLTASDAAPSDQLGVSVALSGDTAVVGTNSSSAYVFVRAGGVWSEQQKLTASDAAPGDRFGVSVAVSGDTAIIGADLDDHAGGSDAGSAYVFHRTGGVWTQQQKLTTSDAAPDDQFGVSVAVSGATAVIGADLDDHAGGTAAGSAYVFGFADCNTDGMPDACDPDTDSDGVVDVCDNCPNIANPGQEDCNSDGTGDACSPDTDSDGLVDVCDNCPSVANPGQEDCNNDGIGDACQGVGDIDSDGVLNNCDNCPDDSNPGQENADGDAAGDACDDCPNDPNKISPGACGCGVPDVDLDSDGLPDCLDNCPGVSNPGQEDEDGDGAGDACDNCLGLSNPGQANADGDAAGDACDGCPNDPNKIAPGVCGCGVTDVDGDSDGLSDCIDNCAGASNPGQEDEDDDGAGDACDNCLGLSNPGQEDCNNDGTGNACDLDTDSDGLVDGCDNCPTVVNPGQQDADDDTIGDACDNCPNDPADCDPPDPDPMTFATPPALLDSTSVTMTATTATDATPPVEYLFQCTSASPGGTSSFWQVGVGYSDAGLSANTPYSYRVAARDSRPTPNQTAFSSEVMVTTAIETPQGLTTGAVGIDFVELMTLGSFTNLTEGQSGLYFDSLTPGGDTGLNVWVQGTMATATGLMPDTDYEFVVKARNRDGVETALTDPITVHTYWVSGDCNNDLVFSVESDLDCIVETLLGNETSPPGGAHRIDLNYNEVTDGEDIQFIIDCLQFGGC